MMAIADTDGRLITVGSLVEYTYGGRRSFPEGTTHHRHEVGTVTEVYKQMVVVRFDSDKSSHRLASYNIKKI